MTKVHAYTLVVSSVLCAVCMSATYTYHPTTWCDVPNFMGKLIVLEPLTQFKLQTVVVVIGKYIHLQTVEQLGVG